MAADRRGLLLAAALGVTLVVAGCGRSGYDSATTRDRLASTVVTVLDRYGLQVDGDHIGCDEAVPAGRITCYGTVTDEPTTTAVAVFDRGPGPGCPGTLRITVGDTPLTTEQANPCR